MHRAISSSARYERPVRVPVILLGGVAVFFLCGAWGVFWEHLSGTLVASPGEGQWTVVVVYAMGAVALVSGLLALIGAWTLFSSRLVIDRDGLRWQKGELLWERVHAVRILVMTRTVPAPAGATLADIWLELRLREPDLTPGQQRAVRSYRIPWTATEGYSHHLHISVTQVTRMSEVTDFAPGIQSVLATVATPIYQGTIVRRTPAQRAVA